ncbi:MAG TPA: hypothetical protein VL400_16545, partial [Polyangiaceae bacterium]|nr:hypothetical protein [Polyangiaceae bacterium]
MTAAAPNHRARRRLRAERAGYTIVEIMIALGVLAIGGSAIIAMQRVSVMGTISAQNLVNASTIASGYASRVEAEGASTWTVNNSTGLAGTIFNRGMTTQDTWIDADPNGTGTDESMVDLRGRAATGTNVAYCSFVRISKLADDTVRVDVRTLYSKQGNSVSAECA